MTAETVKLTRAEDAYVHLASFRRGELVKVDGRQARVIYPRQEPPGARGIEAAYLLVTGYGTDTYVTVRSLLSGRHTITSAQDPEG